MKSYKHFTLEEREYLAKNLKKGKIISEIAKILGRHKSSVSREIKKIKIVFIGISRKYFTRKNSKRNYKLKRDNELRQYYYTKPSNRKKYACNLHYVG